MDIIYGGQIQQEFPDTRWTDRDVAIGLPPDQVLCSPPNYDRQRCRNFRIVARRTAKIFDTKTLPEGILCAITNDHGIVIALTRQDRITSL